MTGYRKVLSSTSGVIERLNQVPRRSNRRRVHINKTKKWAERSVWTMVCAIELGLIEPSTTTTANRPRKRAIRGRKPGWAGKRSTNKGPSPKAINSFSNIHINNNRRMKHKDSPQNLIHPEHPYSLPPSSSFLEPFNLPGVCNVRYNEATKCDMVYNPFAAPRSAAKTLDIYEFTKTIKNQRELRPVGNLSSESPSDSSLGDSSPEDDKMLKNSSGRGKKRVKNFKSSKIHEDLRGNARKNKAALQRVPSKRRYFRRKQKNPYAAQTRKQKRVESSSDEESQEEDPDHAEFRPGSAAMRIVQPRGRGARKSNAKRIADESSLRAQAEANVAEELNRGINYDDSEIDDSLLVDPSTDLHRALLAAADDQNNESIHLSPTFNNSLDLNFESTEFTASLDSLALENSPENHQESQDSDDEMDNVFEKNNNNRSVGKSFKEKPEVAKNLKENARSAVCRLVKRRSADSIVTGSVEDKENLNSNVNGARVTRGSAKIGAVNENSNETSYTIGTVVWGKCMGWWPGLIVDAEDVGMCATEGKSWVYWIGEYRISQLRNKTQVQTFSTGIRARMIDTFRTKSRKDGSYAACLATIKLLNDEILDKGPLTQPYHTWVERHLMRLQNIDQMILYPYPSNVQHRLDELKKENSKTTQRYLSDLKRSAEKPTEKTRTNGLAKSAVKQTTPLDPGCLPLMSQKPGVIAWAKIMGQKWWPAMIIDFRDCGMKEPTFGCQWILWYGDNTLSQVNHRFFLAFEKGIVRMKGYVLTCKKEVYRRGVLDAATDYCAKFGYKTDSWTMEDVYDWFEKFDGSEAANGAASALPGIPGSVEIAQKYPARIVEGLKKHKGNCTVAAIREHNIKDSDDLRRVIAGKKDLTSFCLMCLKSVDDDDENIDHPFFEGELCEECSDKYIPTIFAYGDDGKCFFCTVCAGSDTVVMCDESDCPRVYCTACLKYLIAPRAYDEIMLNDPWLCFLCEDSPESRDGGLLKPRLDWKERVAGLFHSNRESVPNRVEHYKDGKKKIRVLSLFDGISAGLVVLRKLGIEVEVYYASEIDPDAEMVSNAHFGNEIVRLGDVRGVGEKKIREIAPIDLLIGGSPCNDLSLVNPMRLGLHDPAGTGVLVFEYCRVKSLLEDVNGQHFFWLFENVASMPSKYRLEINEHLGREPELIDSANYSPQHRPRLYWGNLPSVSYPLSSQDLQDVLTPNCNRHALVKKIRTVTTRVNSLKQGKKSLKPILMNEENDSVWITELEQIFGFPRHYTDVKNLCATKRQKLIGMSWSVQTITEIMRPLCNFFKVRNLDSP